MAQGLKQVMALKQSLRMTPQLQQAIKLLQLSRMELEVEIRKELDENPVLDETLELKEDDVSRLRDGESNEEQAPDSMSATDQDPQKQDEIDWESYIENQNRPSSTGSAGSEEIMNYENIITAKQTLNDHLMWQVKLGGFNEEEEYLLSVLVAYIDEDGYIKVPIEKIAEDEEVDSIELEEMLPFLHELDPAGVGARDLKECLLIQAKHLEEDTTDLIDLIENHLKDLEKKNYAVIAKALNYEIEDVVEMCKIIYSMDPKPGRAFSPQDVHYVTPDVYVYKVGDEYMVTLNEDGLPRLKISNFYKNMLKDVGTNEKTQEYIQEKLRSAVWLIKSIQQRQRTIFKVTESIIKHQREFLDKGSAFIRPLILREVANDIGMHESTVSRVTTNKFVFTPQGVFELKYFFNSGISKSDGDFLASESVKLKIKKMVTSEDPLSPLSDQKIVELLKKEGIKIARRTVAKYRDVLKILPSSKRKKFY